MADAEKNSKTNVMDVESNTFESVSGKEGNSVGEQPATRTTRIKAHLRKWWWVHAIIVACLTLIIVLVIIFVAVKAIVQSQFSKATLSVIALEATDPKPDSFHFHLETEHLSHTHFKPIIESFNASISLPGAEKPFGYFQTPQMKANTVFNMTIDQDLVIADMDSFIAYNRAVFYNDTVNVLVQGHTKVDLKGLPHYSVIYNQLTSQKGLNGLKNFEIVAVSLFTTPDPVDNATLSATISIPNPSVFTVEMGTITGNLYAASNGTYLGYSIIENFTLRPGPNCFQTRGFLDPMQVAQYITADNTLPLEIKGYKSVNAQGQEIGYYSKTMQSSIINYGLNISAAVLGGGGNTCPK